MKKTLPIHLICLLICAILLSCTGTETKKGFLPNQTAAAYSFIHGEYVGQAVVMTDSEGKLEVEIDEAFLPDILCGVTLGINGWNENTTVFFERNGKRSYVAKYIEYLDKTYVGIQTGNCFVYVQADENGQAVGETTLDKEILRSHETMAAYFDNIRNEKLKIFAQFGGYALPVTLSSYGGLTKRKAPGYWNSGLTWAGNIKAIEDFIEDNGYQYSFSQIKQAEEATENGLKPWIVADIVTGATNSDFKSYFALVQSAISRLKTY